MNKSIIKFVLLSSMRDYLFHSMLFLVVCATMISFFLGSTALVEQQQMQTVYMAASTRIVSICGIILFTVFHIKRLFESKEIEMLLSRPISRDRFVLSYIISFIFLSIIFSLFPIIAVSILGVFDKMGFLYWANSIIFELILVTTFACSAAFVFDKTLPALIATFCFYLLSRMMGFIGAMSQFPTSIPAFSSIESAFYWVLEVVVKCISVFVPRLDLFAQTNHLLYGIDGIMISCLVVAQFFVFFFLLLFITMRDFRYKSF